jgi:uncharacterized protein
MSKHMMNAPPLKLETEELTAPLSEADWEELNELLWDKRWPETKLDAEGVDGVISAGVCGPRSIQPLQVLPLIFGQREMPEFESQEALNRFLQLTMRRWNEYASALNADPEILTPENLITPFCYESDPEQMAIATAWKVPAKPEETAFRPGEWVAREWSYGFMSVVREHRDAWWEIASLDADYVKLLSPMVLLELGFNPDHPRAQFEPDSWLAQAVAHLYHLSTLYRELDQAAPGQLPIVRGAPKVGRNDPCPCGSGLKFKKCCGAGTRLH